MALVLPDRWVWDSWFVWDGDLCHVFYLCASRGLNDPIRRHRYTSVGHAVSKDLVNWEILPDALAPGDQPAFDSYTTWTGSVVRSDDGTWWMFYTGTSREDNGDVQRIGAATSPDLMTWTKVGSTALVEADGRWYEKLDKTVWHDEAWRDPWVFWDDQTSQWSMLVTARANHGDPQTRAVIGYATSHNLANWDVQPPLSAPGQGFGQYEVFQYEVVDGVPLLIFCCGWREFSDKRLAREGKVDAVFSVVCADGLASADFENARAFSDTSLYAARLVMGPDGGWNLIGFVNEVDGKFVGALSDPIPVTATIEHGLITKP